MLETVNPVKPASIEGPGVILGSNALALDNSNEKTIKKELYCPRKIDRHTESVQEGIQNKVARIAQALDNYLQSTQTKLKIEVNSSTGDSVVKVISEEDGKIIREIPPKEMLDLAAKVEEMIGILFNENA